MDDDATKGQMKFGKKFTRLAVALYGDKNVQVFDFNMSTGMVSEPTTIPTPEYPYGIEFSEDGSKLYYSLARGVYQVDLALPLTDLQLSVQPVGYSVEGYPFGDLQIAKDGKIYVAVNNGTWLSSISNPQLAGSDCGFADTALRISSPTLPGACSFLGLPQPLITLPPGGPGAGDGHFVITDTCNSKPTSFSFANLLNVEYIEWDFGDNTYAIGNSITHQFLTAGLYRVTAIIHTEYFNDTVARYVNIVTCTGDGNELDCKMYVPTAFTPNSDGNNDKFRPVITCPAQDYLFRVYNRWGEMIYQSENPQDRWDGTYKDMPCEMGTYFYVVNYRFVGKEERRHVGDVTLVR